MSTFLELGVEANIIKGLNELKIFTPTEIQEEAIPLLLNNETDFVGLAQTGTGKTAAYGLPVLHKIDAEKPQIQALILSPTRELVLQIKKQLFKFTKYSEDKIFTEAVYGGEKIDIQIKNLKRPTHIVVATPGRLVDLMERGDIKLTSVTTLILDEADEMLSMGFKDDLTKIIRETGRQKSTWLFSATMPEGIQQIVKKYMSPKAPRVETNRKSLINENITHQFIRVTRSNKEAILVNLLDSKKEERGIIFTRTKANAQQVTKLLKEEGFSVEALEGNMQQKEREKAMRAFKKENIQFMVSTDVSARGIDVQDLGFVIHYQLPEQLEYYTHRSGRTARAGKTGFSIALVLPHEIELMKDISKKLEIQFIERK
ncbi:DEAD/DEAH box helicase [Mesonia ostreae]|uniref:DEAD/DEAH box helicase n=1 Tax=Mesonia ostreae TaxID=861110 RepID=A0ABU2KHT1_9FLAO|nr:DEAD/DEAH box helicase [Mesonia ostreae]MDT0294265.1 DEAD/DEAH box helicase [Mesonia ostreae]